MGNREEKKADKGEKKKIKNQKKINEKRRGSKKRGSLDPREKKDNLIR